MTSDRPYRYRTTIDLTIWADGLDAAHQIARQAVDAVQNVPDARRATICYAGAAIVNLYHDQPAGRDITRPDNGSVMASS